MTPPSNCINFSSVFQCESFANSYIGIQGPIYDVINVFDDIKQIRSNSLLWVWPRHSQFRSSRHVRKQYYIDTLIDHVILKSAFIASRIAVRKSRNSNPISSYLQLISFTKQHLPNEYSISQFECFPSNTLQNSETQSIHRRNRFIIDNRYCAKRSS